MRTTIYMGMSLDGFVARTDDRLDFLDEPKDEGSAPTAGSEVPGGDADSDHMKAFAEFMATVDVVVMGRRTFEVVLPFSWWPYGKTPVVVLSRKWTAPPPGSQPTVRIMAGEPAEVLRALEADGLRHAYVDGAETSRAFLAAGLITDLVVTHVPVLIGTGITPWGPLPGDVRLKLVSTRPFGGNAVQTRWSVVPRKG